MKLRWHAVGLALALASPAWGAEDGGTVSPLALGAGNRALALGGAFTAIADDASGWMWNPAGMGLVTRAEFQASQTSYGELGSTELYAGYVHPSWRWGALAASYRQFGVNGIEGRDDRNVLLPGELTDRESELALGYGREFSPGWSAGAVAKVRRHELAGRSANAIGADMGLTLRPGLAFGSDRSWWRDLAVGVAVRNVVQPALRLDVDEVPDPRGARLGLAWRYGTFMPALATLDVESTEGRSARLHAGLQMSAHPSLDLRVGMTGGHLTAGTGVRVHGLTLDYAFEDGPIVPVHRAGLSMRFGMTMDEGRAQAQRQREDELQARLAEAFDQRLRERVDEVAARAAEARAAGDCDAALQQVATLRALAPDDPRAAALEAQCLVDQARASEAENDLAGAIVLYGRALTLVPQDTTAAAGLRRARAASDARAARSEDLRRRFSAALDAFATGDLAAARRGLQEILRQRPGDDEASAMLRRVQRSIDRQVSNLLEQAEGFVGTGLFGDAERAIAAARALEPADPGVARLADALERAQQQLAARAMTPRPETDTARRRASGQSELSAQDRRDLEALYERGVGALQQGRSNEAMRYFELVWSKDPGHARVAEYLKREYLTRGLEAFAAGRLRDAVGLWEQALRVDPRDDRTRAYLSRAQEHLARTNAIGNN